MANSHVDASASDSKALLQHLWTQIEIMEGPLTTEPNDAFTVVRVRDMPRGSFPYHRRHTDSWPRPTRHCEPPYTRQFPISPA